MKFNIFSFFLRWFFSTILLVFMSFLLLRLMPGGPFDDESRMHPLVREKLELSWGLKEDYFKQFLLYTKSVFQLELGYSLQSPGQSVASILSSRISHTWILNVIVICLVIFLSFVLSFFAFYSQRIRDMIFLVHRLIFSLPILFLAPMSMFIFSFYFELLPFAFLDTKLNYILPIFVLCLRPIAVLSQIQIRNQDEIQKQNFMKVAKAKGLTEQRLFFVHTLKNSLPMTASYFPDILVGLVSGSFLVEMLFSIPGLGLLFVESIGERDYPMIVGITLVLGALFIFLSQLVETLQQSLDPRKRIQLV